MSWNHQWIEYISIILTSFVALPYSNITTDTLKCQVGGLALSTLHSRYVASCRRRRVRRSLCECHDICFLDICLLTLWSAFWNIFSGIFTLGIHHCWKKPREGQKNCSCEACHSTCRLICRAWIQNWKSVERQIFKSQKWKTFFTWPTNLCD